jgi:uncharacterized protein (DUF433 family)
MPLIIDVQHDPAAEPGQLAGVLLSRLEALEHSVQFLLGRGVEKTAGVCGGSARIVRTRIPVWILEGLRRQGASEADLLAAYPTISAADLVAAWAYVAANRHEIDGEIVANNAV